MRLKPVGQLTTLGRRARQPPGIFDQPLGHTWEHGMEMRHMPGGVSLQVTPRVAVAGDTRDQPPVLGQVCVPGSGARQVFFATRNQLEGQLGDVGMGLQNTPRPGIGATTWRALQVGLGVGAIVGVTPRGGLPATQPLGQVFTDRLRPMQPPLASRNCDDGQKSEGLHVTPTRVFAGATGSQKAGQVVVVGSGERQPPVIRRQPAGQSMICARWHVTPALVEAGWSRFQPQGQVVTDGMGDLQPLETRRQPAGQP